MDERRPGVEALLAEQVAYYRACAPEYDEAYERRGRHDHGPAANDAWLEGLAAVRAVLDDLPLDGAQVLELAAGTGVWTEALVARARVTAVDAAAEMLERNQTRLGSLATRVRYELGDVFASWPDESFDAVVFGFWITHVPAERLDSFLRSVAGTLRPGGWIFFVDDRERSFAVDEVSAQTEGASRVTVRRLNDGREYRIVKHFWAPATLEDRCRLAGLDVTVHQTDHLQYGVGRRRGPKDGAHGR